MIRKHVWMTVGTAGMAFLLVIGGVRMASAAQMPSSALSSAAEVAVDSVLSRDAALSRGGGPWGGFGGRSIDHSQLLADALGITVDELEAARDQANQAAIDQAIAEGLITQEEADEMQARRAVASYLDRDALVAAALGMTVEELETAYAEGATRSTLAAEKGLDEAAFQAALEQAAVDALAQAVEDGVITQEQADALQADGVALPGLSGSRGRGGHGGARGHDRGGERPAVPSESDGPDSGTALPGTDMGSGQDA